MSPGMNRKALAALTASVLLPLSFIGFVHFVAFLLGATLDGTVRDVLVVLAAFEHIALLIAAGVITLDA